MRLAARVSRPRGISPPRLPGPADGRTGRHPDQAVCTIGSGRDRIEVGVKLTPAQRQSRRGICLRGCGLGRYCRIFRGHSVLLPGRALGFSVVAVPGSVRMPCSERRACDKQVLVVKAQARDPLRSSGTLRPQVQVLSSRSTRRPGNAGLGLLDANPRFGPRGTNVRAIGLHDSRRVSRQKPWAE